MFEILKPDEQEEISKCYHVVAVAIETISRAPIHPVHLSHLVPGHPGKEGPWGWEQSVGELIRGTARPYCSVLPSLEKVLKNRKLGSTSQLPVEERKRNIKSQRSKLVLVELQQTKEIQSDLCFAV